MKKQITKLVFVGGCGRSGTTLLQAILNAHKDIYGGPEFGYIPMLCETKTKIQSSINPRNKLDVYLNEERLNRSFEKLMIDLISWPAEKANAKIISEKSPHNIIAFNELSIVFPTAKFIFVVRDPRAIYASAKQIKKKAKVKKSSEIPGYSKNVTKAIEYINKTWEIGFEFVKNNPSRSTIVFYEDLVLEPENTTKKICEFLNIKWEKEMLNHSVKMNSIININEESIWGGSDMYHQSIHTTSLKKWENILTEYEKYIIARNIIKNDIVIQKYSIDDSNTEINFSLGIIQHHIRKWYYEKRKILIKKLKKIF